MENEKESQIKEYLALNATKWVRKLTSKINLMDGRCRQMMLSRPQRPITEYCTKCQELLKKTMEECLE